MAAPVEKLKFFRMWHMSIAGERVRTLRHGMSGVPGLEIWGDYRSYTKIREAIMGPGEEFGLRPCGGRAYPPTPLSRAGFRIRCPAIYSDGALRPYREWLPADSVEAENAIAGQLSCRTHRRLLPHAVGARIRRFIKYDHDFIGRSALEKMEHALSAKKVTFAWNARI